MQPLGPFEAAPRIAVAVSGGADSMALMLLAHRWASARGGEAVGLTVDHGLRPEAAAEARRVAASPIACCAGVRRSRSPICRRRHAQRAIACWGNGAAALRCFIYFWRINWRIRPRLSCFGSGAAAASKDSPPWPP